ncbi:hypothetical protein BKA69DRAFT_95587 [Paraphysoderma sedebokerense]|nr:hypothetical protein BKA69DRAFT_95587 [Paraphysoderma sedebokerense]
MSGAEITVDMDTLTKCITLLIGDHYTCLNIRRELLAKNELTLPSELKFNKLLLSKWYKSSGLWWHRFRVVQQFLDLKTSVHQPTRCRELYQNESDFLKSILLRDGRNYYVWLYKIRLLKLMSRSVDSSDFFNQMLNEERNTLHEYTSRNPSNYSAFSYRLHILLLTVNRDATFESRSLPTNSHASHLANVSGSIAPSFKTESNTLILRDEFTSIFAIIKSYSHFEAPWSYLKSFLTLLVGGSCARLPKPELSVERRVRQVLQHVLDEETVGGIMEVIRYGTTVDVNQENLYGEEESKMCVQRKNDFVSWLNKML